MVKLIAHRGASAEAPENTLSAIQKAVNLSVDYIEIDVRLSSDGIPIVIHDPTLKRTTNCPKSLHVSKLPFNDILAYDAGLWFSEDFKGEKISTLKDVLKLDLGSCGLMIEIKKGPYSSKKIAEAVSECLSKNAPPSLNYKIGSFDLPILNAFRKLGFHSLIGIVETEKMLNHFVGIPIKHLALWHPLITPPLIQFLHERDTQVWTFTIDDSTLIHSLISHKVDGIITNNPRHIKTFI